MGRTGAEESPSNKSSTQAVETSLQNLYLKLVAMEKEQVGEWGRAI